MTEEKMSCMKPYPLGAHVEEGAIRFSFVSEKDDCGILIYDKKTGKEIDRVVFGPNDRIGNVRVKYLTGLDADAITYQFFEGDRVVPDRNARQYALKNVYGRVYRERDLKALIPCGDFAWEGDVCPRIPYSESVCYCAHVRGFTRHASSGVLHRGTFAGLAEKLDYLKEIGVTTVELQPVYEFAEIATEEERERLSRAPGLSRMAEMDSEISSKCNYWGYKRGYYYAPKEAYSSTADAVTEFKRMVKDFHRAGLEIILQFYFPGEVNLLEIPDILRFWVLEYHVDGFHLMGADLPADMLARDPLLADTKLWYDYFNTDRIYGAAERPKRRNLAVCQDDYLYVMRRFLKGDEDMLGQVTEQMRRIPDKTGRIHYMSNYFGFTLMDMVSYDRKHNEPNGEDNRDGNNYNCSWNCGEEGVSRRKKIVELRHRQVKNAIAMLLFSQSVPMIFMGDEFGNSQKGNNNPYCQDNTVAWLNWNDISKNRDIYDFWKQMVKIRREHPILHPECELRIMDHLSCGYPDLSYHGQNAWRPRMEGYNRHIGVMYCGKYARTERGGEDAFFYLGMNMYWEKQELALPKLPKGLKWELLCSTFDGEKGEITAEGLAGIRERSVSVYVSVPDDIRPEKGRQKKGKKEADRCYDGRGMEAFQDNYIPQVSGGAGLL